MSIYARLRVLLALSILVIGGCVWLIAGQQRDAVIGMQGQLRASTDLLTAMLDQVEGRVMSVEVQGAEAVRENCWVTRLRFMNRERREDV